MGFMRRERARTVAPAPAARAQPARIADQREPAADRGLAPSALALALATQPLMLARENAAGLSDLDLVDPAFAGRQDARVIQRCATGGCDCPDESRHPGSPDGPPARRGVRRYDQRPGALHRL